MDLSKIKELLKIVAESDVAEVEIEEDDFKVVVRRNAPSVTIQQAPFASGYPMPMGGYPAYPPAAPAAPTPAPASAHSPAPAPEAAEERPVVAAKDEASGNQTVVRAPIVGTFYRRPSPDDEPFVKVGDSVKPSDVLCIIEAMKLMNEIECEVEGTITKIFAEDGQPVEYDQELFVVELG